MATIVFGEIGRGDRVAEGARLEIVCARKGTAGSNPALSAGSPSDSSAAEALGLQLSVRTLMQRRPSHSRGAGAPAARGIVVPPTKTR